MNSIKNNILLFVAVVSLFWACKSETTNNTATSTTTTSTPATSSAAPTPTALATSLSNLKEVQLPFAINTKIDKNSVSSANQNNIEAFKKDFGFSFDEGAMEIPSAAFRAKINNELQIVAVLYSGQIPNGSSESATLRLFKNDGSPVGEPVVFEYMQSMSNMYAAGETDITIKIEADKITTSGTSTSIDPNGVKADKVENLPETQNAITASGITKN